MISILITLLLYVLVAGVIVYCIGLLPIPQPWSNVARALVILIVLLVFLNALGWVGQPYGWRLR